MERNKEFIARVEKELHGNILPFWINNVIDQEFEGFYGQITNELQIDTTAPKGCILNARILWAYSAAYRIFKDEKFLMMADRAYDYIKKYFWDNEYSGSYWMVDYKGNPIDTKKQIYSQAFTVYALSEYNRATGNEESLKKAIELFEKIEKHSYDTENKGYFEACTREWGVTEDLRLSDKDMNEKKSMNTHLHVMEAYTNLYRVWKSQELARKLKELIEIAIEHIIDNNTWHFKLFFDEKWTSKANITSYGHDIEGSWLLFEAAEVLSDEELVERCKAVAINMAKVTLEEGIVEDGSIIYEKHGDGKFDMDRHWWPQAEAVVGFINAYQLTGDIAFYDASEKCWSYIEEHIVDKVNGEWFWMAEAKGNKHHEMFKVDPWKCPYHNSRACYEILERLSKSRE